MLSGYRRFAGRSGFTYQVIDHAIENEIMKGQYAKPVEPSQQPLWPSTLR